LEGTRGRAIRPPTLKRRGGALGTPAPPPPPPGGPGGPGGVGCQPARGPHTCVPRRWGGVFSSGGRFFASFADGGGWRRVWGGGGVPPDTKGGGKGGVSRKPPPSRPSGWVRLGLGGILVGGTGELYLGAGPAEFTVRAGADGGEGGGGRGGGPRAAPGPPPPRGLSCRSIHGDCLVGKAPAVGGRRWRRARRPQPRLFCWSANGELAEKLVTGFGARRGQPVLARGGFGPPPGARLCSGLQGAPTDACRAPRWETGGEGGGKKGEKRWEKNPGVFKKKKTGAREKNTTAGEKG